MTRTGQPEVISNGRTQGGVVSENRTSGSGGTGKTTLAEILSRMLGVPKINEGVRSYMKKHGITHLRELDAAGTKRLQEKVIGGKIMLERDLPSFVADRTTIDNVAYCLRWLGREDEMAGWLGPYIERAIEHAKTYDLIIVCPWGAFPLEDDGVRSSKPWYQLEIQMILNGLIATNPDLEARSHRLKAITVADRIDEIMGVIQNWRPAGCGR